MAGLHLDSAACSRQSFAVIDVTAQHARYEAEVGGYVAAEAATPVLHAGRAAFAALSGMPDAQVVYTTGSLNALDLLLGSWPADRRTLACLPGEYGPNLALMAAHGFDRQLLPTMADGRVALDDAAGITARFNRNVLAVVNRELDADFDIGAFTHVARWNAAEERIEMWLRADAAQRARIGALDMVVEFTAGEEMLTEVSCKFRAQAVAAELAAAGLRRIRWWTDDAGDFGLSLAAK